MTFLKRILGLPLWSGVAALISIIALILAFMELEEKENTATGTQVITNGSGNIQVQGEGNSVQK